MENDKSTDARKRKSNCHSVEECRESQRIAKEALLNAVTQAVTHHSERYNFYNNSISCSLFY